jgi:hypothetical protein
MCVGAVVQSFTFTEDRLHVLTFKNRASYI